MFWKSLELMLPPMMLFMIWYAYVFSSESVIDFVPRNRCAWFMSLVKDFANGAYEGSETMRGDFDSPRSMNRFSKYAQTSSGSNLPATDTTKESRVYWRST